MSTRHNIEQLLEKSSNIQQFSKHYFSYFLKLLNELDLDAIAAFADEMEKARQNRNTIFFIGNGGSAVTASHMANDFGNDIRKRTKTDTPFRVLSLTDNTAVMLAIANDDGYDNLFVDQLRIHYQRGDKLVAISASGNSQNIVTAAEWVKAQGGVVMALVGFDGGKLKEFSDVVIHVKSMKGEFGPVEDIHLIMGHLLSYWLQHRIQKEQNMEKK
ncbi:SIS domain-containing protein [bacterium]|nr:SIS domain-containing protein [bacterium]